MTLSYKIFRLFLLPLVLSVLSTGQVNAQSRKQLEKRRRQIRQEINRISWLMQRADSKEKDKLSEYRLLDAKIRLQQSLINNIRREIKRLDYQISRKKDTIGQKQAELKELKANYAEAVRKAYKFSAREKLLYFILSAESFQQAWRRMRYIKEYNAYIRKKAADIEQKQKELNLKIRSLSEKKHEKTNWLTRLKDEQNQLLKEKQKQRRLIADLQKQKKKYLREIKVRQREARKIDRLIEKMIAREIARTNKARGKRKRNVFVLTPEGKKLASAFYANKGRLPWPVRHGYISRRFGKHRNPVFKHVTDFNTGIYINTPEHEPVYAVFDGKISMVQIIPGGNTTIMIRHGNYITIYGNLVEIQVKPGQKVHTGQLIGYVGKNPATGMYVIKFRIYKNMQKLNPELWLSRK